MYAPNLKFFISYSAGGIFGAVSVGVIENSVPATIIGVIVGGWIGSYFSR